MRLLGFALYDSKAKYFTPPFFCSNEDVARRMVAAMVADRNTMVGQFPTDWTLFQIGSYEDGAAGLEACSPLVNLGLADQFARPAAPHITDTERN